MSAEPPTIPPLSARGLKKFSESVKQPPFRGTMVENRAGAPMGKGHGNNGQPFDIAVPAFSLDSPHDRPRLN